jgi:hypothetical protein
LGCCDWRAGCDCTRARAAVVDLTRSFWDGVKAGSFQRTGLF